MSWTATIGGSTYPISFNKTVQTLNDWEIGYFTVEANEAMVNLLDTTPTTVIKFVGATVLSGKAGSYKYIEGGTKLDVEVYDAVYYDMYQKVHPDGGEVTTSVIYNPEDCDNILSAVATDAGVTAGTCPSDSLIVKFNRANTFQIVKFLARAVNSDFYSSGGDTINIGARGSAKGRLQILGDPSRRKVSAFKNKDKVIIRGTDVNGAEIEGSAGTGDKIRVYTEKKANDTATLDNIAESYLTELNASSNAVKLISPIEYSWGLKPGDTVIINNKTYGLSGSYRIWKITKKETYSEVEIDRAEDLIEKYLSDQQDMEDYGIFTSSSAILDNPVGNPPTVTTVAASANIQGNRITWDRVTVADLEEYIIYRSTSASATTEIARARTNLFIDQGATIGQIYYYRVKAVDRVGNVSTNYSNEDNATSVKVDTAQLADDAVTFAKVDPDAVPMSVSTLDLELYLTFEEGTGSTVKDLSTNGLVGTVSGGTWVDGQHGKAIELTGAADKIDLSGSVVLTGALAVAGWFYITSYAGNPGILGDQTLLANGRLAFRSNATGIEVYTGTPANGDIEASITFPSSTWFYLGLSRTVGGVWSVYYNGADVSSTNPTIAGDIPVARVGDNPNDSLWTSIAGRIDQIRAYNKELTAGEMMAIYRNSTVQSFVDTNWIVDNAVDTEQLADGAVDTTQLAADAVDGTKLSDDAVDSEHIANTAIDTAHISNSAITVDQIANATITGSKIANTTIVAANITNSTITGAKIASATIEGSNIHAETITAANITDSTVTATQIASATITGSEIAATTITAANITASTITTDQIANATITGSDIAATTIDAGNISNSTITATQVAALTITGSKIKALTIEAGKIANSTITATQIAATTITKSNLVGKTITAGEIALSTITVNEMAALSVGESNIIGQAVSIGKMNTNISAQTFAPLFTEFDDFSFQEVTEASTHAGEEVYRRTEWAEPYMLFKLKQVFGLFFVDMNLDEAMCDIFAYSGDTDLSGYFHLFDDFIGRKGGSGSLDWIQDDDSTAGYAFRKPGGSRFSPVYQDLMKTNGAGSYAYTYLDKATGGIDISEMNQVCISIGTIAIAAGNASTTIDLMMYTDTNNYYILEDFETDSLTKTTYRIPISDFTEVGSPDNTSIATLRIQMSDPSEDNLRFSSWMFTKCLIDTFHINELEGSLVDYDSGELDLEFTKGEDFHLVYYLAGGLQGLGNYGDKLLTVRYPASKVYQIGYLEAN